MEGSRHTRSERRRPPAPPVHIPAELSPVDRGRGIGEDPPMERITESDLALRIERLEPRGDPQLASHYCFIQDRDIRATPRRTSPSSRSARRLRLGQQPPTALTAGRRPPECLRGSGAASTRACASSTTSIEHLSTRSSAQPVELRRGRRHQRRGFVAAGAYEDEYVRTERAGLRASAAGPVLLRQDKRAGRGRSPHRSEWSRVEVAAGRAKGSA